MLSCLKGAIFCAAKLVRSAAWITAALFVFFINVSSAGAAPSISSHPSDRSVGLGGQVTFSVTASNATTYQWQLNNGSGFRDVIEGGVYSGATTATLTITGAGNDLHISSYRVVVGDGVAPPITSRPAMLIIYDPRPSISVHPQPSTVCEGSNATFNVIANYTTGYQWQTQEGGDVVDVIDDTRHSGATTSTLTITGATLDMNDNQYHVFLSGAAAQTDWSFPAQLSVIPRTVITGHPANSTVLAGGTTTLAATGNAERYSWSVDDGSGYFTVIYDDAQYSGSSTSALTITGATAAMNGYKYRVAAGGPCGTVRSAPATLAVYSPPAISHMSPMAGPTAGGTQVTITGTDFSRVKWVFFGTTSAAFTLRSPTSISAVAPDGDEGTVNVRLETPDQTSDTPAAAQFTYVAAPTVSSVFPSAGPTAGGTSVTITGTRFTGATSVTVDGTPVNAFTLNDAGSITFAMPAHVSGAVAIGVTTDGGTGTLTNAYTFVAPPMVTSVSPSVGTTAGGTPATITGTNFSGTLRVTIGGFPAGYAVLSNTQIYVAMPAGTAGDADILVETAGGAATLAGAYRYMEPATANPVSATVAANSSANPITLNITDGAPDSVAIATPPSHGVASATGTTIAYTPTAGYSGADSFTYTATNAAGTSTAATVTMTVTAPTLVFTPAAGALAGGTIRAAYSQTISASGGTAPYSYALAAGAPPDGLTLDPATGTI
ncbi:MAG: IPT/TIG domain-containing protein, partial [Shinella sp.]|uniref:IPT/TIG domain-containing protein n=1 Tax=Shinella sp. TaxID=1870904 RepID=UPI003C70719A